jgi:hypothetical protein
MADKTQLPVLHREAQVVAGSLDEKQRTFDIVWTAGAEVPRIDWWTGQRYVEVLEVSEKAIRLDRFNSGRAPVLDSHQRYSLTNVLGNIVKNSTRVADGKATATVRLSNREDIAGIVGDIRDGIISNVSPGYITHAYREEMRDNTTYRIATDWEPIENSFVPVGADPDAGLARGLADGFLRDGKGRDVATFPCLVIRADAGDVLDAAAAARVRMDLLAREFRL